MALAHVELKPAQGTLKQKDTTVQDEALQRKILPNSQTKNIKVPRNAPCPCGSGKKYKHCHGKI